MLFEDRNPCPWLDRWLDKHDVLVQRVWRIIGWTVAVFYLTVIVGGVVLTLKGS